ncbi:MAG: GNAT family N-acetyltransferase [Anaerolineae bacterium]|nr:GNAT family N-acetyltransferase [Anaerolineae bacterium]
MDLYFRPAQPDETSIVLQLLKEAALWLQKKRVDYWQDWLNPPLLFVQWIQQGFERGEFYLVYQQDELIGCFRLQWEDDAFWGTRAEPAGYLHSLTTVRRLAGQRWGEHILTLIEAHCQAAGKEYLRLDCGSQVTGLCRYYELNGFQQVGSTTVHGEALTLYEKRIKPQC